MHWVTEVQRAYIAGVFDGEGCITIGQQYTRKESYQIGISISNTKIELLQIIKNIIQAGEIYGRRERDHVLFIGSSDRYRFLSLIEPYSIIKTKQIRLAKQFVSFRRPCPGYLFTQIELKQLRSMCIDMQILNDRKPFKREDMIKPHYLGINKLSNTEASYFAGIIDGEGGIEAYMKKKGCIVKLSITNCNLNIINWVLKTVGSGNLEYREGTSTWNSRGRVCYHKAIYVKSILEQVLPYLTIKKERAKITLAIIEQMNPRSIVGISEERQLLREILIEELAILNKRHLPDKGESR